MQLRDIDLNLLVAFTVLVAEAHVSRAAQRLGISQSSTSLALAKLRVMFKDPILVKAGNAMAPTERALRLLPQVEALLHEVEALVQDSAPFDPAKSKDRITMIITDYIDFVVMPRLMTELARQAPDISLKLVGPNPMRIGEVMSNGQVDVSITYFPVPPENVRVRPLFSDRMVAMARNEHPLFRETLTLEKFCAYGHVAIEPGEGATMYNALVDNALRDTGLARRIVLSKPTFLGVPFVVAQTDLIAILPERVARQFTTLAPIRLFEPPMQMEPFNVVLMWHDRTHHSPLHQWFRGTLADICQNLGPVAPRTDSPALA
ncbi:MAG TPA: LysR family transcriptional regulator [Noviherbaspirillum sp.]